MPKKLKHTPILDDVPRHWGIDCLGCSQVNFAGVCHKYRRGSVYACDACFKAGPPTSDQWAHQRYKLSDPKAWHVWKEPMPLEALSWMEWFNYGVLSSAKTVFDTVPDLHVDDCLDDDPLLHRAVRSGVLELVAWLVEEANATVDSLDGSFNTPLYVAVSEGHLEVARYLHSKGADPCRFFDDNETLLWPACSSCDPDVVAQVLAWGVDPKHRNTDGETALHSLPNGTPDDEAFFTAVWDAVVDGAGVDPTQSIVYDLARVSLPLLQRGVAGLGGPTKLTKTKTLVASACHGSLETLQWVLSPTGANVTLVTTGHRSPLLMAAKDAEDPRIVPYLLQAGCDPNVATKNYAQPPLLLAAQREHHVDTVRALVEAGADVTAYDEDKAHLLIACPWGGTHPVGQPTADGSIAGIHRTWDDELTPLIIEQHDVDPFTRNDDGENALHNAYDNRAALEYLLAYGRSHGKTAADVAPLPGKDPWWWCLLTSTVPWRALPLVQWLREQRLQDGDPPLVDLSAVDDSDVTTVCAAADNAVTLHMLRYLVAEAPADGLTDVQQPNGDGDAPLHLACNSRTEYPDAVRFLVQEVGADPTAVGEDGNTPLHYAAGRGHPYTARFLLAQDGVDVDASNDDDSTPMLEAADCRGGAPTVRLLVEAGANVSAKNDSQEGLLNLLSSRAEAADIVAWLLKRPAVLATVDEKGGGWRGTYPVLSAASKANLAMVRAIVDAGADTSVTTGDGGLLHAACDRRGIPMDLLRYVSALPKMDVNEQNEDDEYTPLLCAANYRCNLDAMKFLVDELGADLTLVSDRKQSVLHFACEQGDNLDVVRWLVEEKGMDVNLVGYEEQTPLFLALKRDNATALYLLDHGADPTIVDEDGNTPLFVAAEDSSVVMVKRLLSMPGVDVNHTNNDGENALFPGCYRTSGCKEIVEALIEAGIQAVNLPGERTASPLFRLFGYSPHVPTLKLLVDNGLDLNVRDRDGHTAVWELMSSSDATVIDCLDFMHKACDLDVQYVDEEGRSLLFPAADYGAVKTCRWLLDHGVDPHIRDEDGRNVLWTVCEARDQTERSLLWKMFVEELSVDYETTDNNEKSVLETAAEEDAPEIVDWIVAHASEGSRTAAQAKTLLNRAAEKKDTRKQERKERKLDAIRRAALEGRLSSIVEERGPLVRLPLCNSPVTDKLVKWLATKTTLTLNVRDLDLSSCWGLSGQGVRVLLANCPALERVWLELMPQLTWAEFVSPLGDADAEDADTALPWWEDDVSCPNLRLIVVPAHWSAHARATLAAAAGPNVSVEQEASFGNVPFHVSKLPGGNAPPGYDEDADSPDWAVNVFQPLSEYRLLRVISGRKVSSRVQVWDARTRRMLSECNAPPGDPDSWSKPVLGSMVVGTDYVRGFHGSDGESHAYPLAPPDTDPNLEEPLQLERRQHRKGPWDTQIVCAEKHGDLVYLNTNRDNVWVVKNTPGDVEGGPFGERVAEIAHGGSNYISGFNEVRSTMIVDPVRLVAYIAGLRYGLVIAVKLDGLGDVKDSRAVVGKFKGHVNLVSGMAVGPSLEDPSRRVLYTAAFDGTVRRWNTDTFECEAEWTLCSGDEKELRSITLCDGVLFVTRLFSQAVYVLDAATGTVLRKLTKHSDAVWETMVWRGVLWTSGGLRMRPHWANLVHRDVWLAEDSATVTAVLAAAEHDAIVVADVFMGYTLAHLTALRGNVDMLRAVLAAAPELRLATSRAGRTPQDVIEADVLASMEKGDTEGRAPWVACKQLLSEATS